MKDSFWSFLTYECGTFVPATLINANPTMPADVHMHTRTDTCIVKIQAYGCERHVGFLGTVFQMLPEEECRQKHVTSLSLSLSLPLAGVLYALTVKHLIITVPESIEQSSETRSTSL